MNNKKKNKLIIIVIILIVLLVVGIILFKVFNNKEGKLTTSVNSTNIEETESYKMDLRIYGKYNEESINDIIMVSNYKNTDKEITITSKEKEEKYVVKGNKKYKVEEEILKEVKNVPYEDTEVYLNGVSNVKKVKYEKEEKIGEETYKVYTGVIEKKEMENILQNTSFDIKPEKETETEVWLTKEKKVYKVYYKLDSLTIYASYFGYGNMREVNLDIY